MTNITLKTHAHTQIRYIEFEPGTPHIFDLTILIRKSYLFFFTKKIPLVLGN
jgi:hypothetical protein